jgi:transposase
VASRRARPAVTAGFQTVGNQVWEWSGVTLARHLSRRLYRHCHTVENFFARIKRCRRTATRCEKLANHYLGFPLLAAILAELKSGV